MTAKEFWKQRFGEYPQNDAEKLAAVMMASYAEYCKEQDTTPSPMDKLVEWLEGEYKASFGYGYKSRENLLREILAKAKELHAERR